MSSFFIFCCKRPKLNIFWISARLTRGAFLGGLNFNNNIFKTKNKLNIFNEKHLFNEYCTAASIQFKKQIIMWFTMICEVIFEIRFRFRAIGARRTVFGVRYSVLDVSKKTHGIRQSAFGIRNSAFRIRDSVSGIGPIDCGF